MLNDVTAWLYSLFELSFAFLGKLCALAVVVCACVCLSVSCDGILRFHHRASLSCGARGGRCCCCCCCCCWVVVVVVFNFCIAKASFASRFCRAPRETMETQFAKKKGHVFLRLPLFKELFRLARAISFQSWAAMRCYGMTGVPLLKNTRMINLPSFFCIWLYMRQFLFLMWLE